MKRKQPLSQQKFLYFEIMPNKFEEFSVNFAKGLNFYFLFSTVF